MGFFKDFKADFSQAVNELIPEDDVDITDNTDQMVNTLDSEASTSSEEAENEMKEWLEGIIQEDMTENISEENSNEVSVEDVAENISDDETNEVSVEDVVENISDDETIEEFVEDVAENISEEETSEETREEFKADSTLNIWEEETNEDMIYENVVDESNQYDSTMDDDIDKLNEEIIEGMEGGKEDMGEKVDFDENENVDVNVDEFDENVDMELLDALNAEEEQTEEKKSSDKKVRAASLSSEDDVTVISKGTTINGSISSDGSLDIMGNITGDVECLGKLSITGKIIGNSTAAEVYINTERLEGSVNSEGSVKVGLGTVVVGDIVATSGVIAGAVKGEIDINGPIVIDSTAIIKGNIKAKSVQINNGAVVEGFCSLSYSDVDLDNVFE